MSEFLVTDLEAFDWSRMRCAVVMSSTGEVENFTDLESWRDHLEKRKTNVFAHYGGNFDYLYLMPLQSVCLSGSRIRTAQIGTSRLHDSSDLMDDKLAKIGKAVGIEKTANRSNRMEYLTESEAMEHCENDCDILLAAVTEHREFMESVDHPKPRWPTTSGASAIYLIEALERDLVAHLERNPLDVVTWYRMNDAVQGPRCEVFKIGEVSGVNAYDVNSSYSRSYLESPLPLGPWREVRKEAVGKQGLYWCEVIKQNRSTLPICQPDHAWRYNGKGWLTSEEIAAVREGCGTVKVTWGWVSEASGWLGRDFVKAVYPFKQSKRPFAKGLLNAPHGKAVQGLTSETFFHTPNGYVKEETLTAPKWYQQPLIGAFVFARARLRLGRIMQKLVAAGWRVYYCDTDSIHTDCPPERFPVSLGDEVGDWRCEGTDLEAVYVAPKLYGLKDDKGRIKIASKGVSPNLIQWQTRNGTQQSPEWVNKKLWEKLVSASRGEAVVVKERGGLVGFRSMATTWGGSPKVDERTRTLRAHGGGKRENDDGTLAYAD